MSNDESNGYSKNPCVIGDADHVLTMTYLLLRCLQPSVPTNLQLDFLNLKIPQVIQY